MVASELPSEANAPLVSSFLIAPVERASWGHPQLVGPQVPWGHLQVAGLQSQAVCFFQQAQFSGYFDHFLCSGRSCISAWPGKLWPLSTTHTLLRHKLEYRSWDSKPPSAWPLAPLHPANEECRSRLTGRKQAGRLPLLSGFQFLGVSALALSPCQLCFP